MPAPGYTSNPMVRRAGRIGMWVLWFKAMGISALVWTVGFCFALMGALLPWRPLAWINWGLLGAAVVIFYGAWRLDRMIWVEFRRARGMLVERENASPGSEAETAGGRRALTGKLPASEEPSD